MSKEDCKTYVCGYNHCLHSGEPVPKCSAVKVGRRYYHWDCASIKQEIQECAELYMNVVDDKTVYPIVMRILNTLVFKNEVPVDYIKKRIEASSLYYRGKPVYALYGIRNMFWEREFKV